MQNTDALQRLHAAAEEALSRPGEFARIHRYFKMVKLLSAVESARDLSERSRARKALSNAVEAARMHARRNGYTPNTCRAIRAEVRATLEALK
jgi:hypothetical protein